eukprot:CAMPEP_0206280562 /NCGR_PEP_ID=MMETSP0047_2-20121206/38646_1 /ASSEMBLY_ACC=CAM_ASM_000192 /TAXON_ID=195065 /ORGANISM="Chroomonas mesostigmatica_cf, Strain CCMP1168" /LENGTH=396 /DNA_ID=CAMNT_0053710635 /DNA_START=45 /DNA_END=1235 /DNA_ORIENTATION=+
MAAMSLKCNDCGKQLKNAEEAQTHAEETMHTNFEESTEAILQLVCKECGKPCRTQTEREMHTKRNPGHDEFIDKTNEQAAVTYDTPAAGGGSAGGGGDTEMQDADVVKERVSDRVNKEIIEQLKDMGFPEVRAEKGLWLTGNSNLEAAITWLADHAEDADIDEPLMVAPEKPESKLSKEEKQKLLDEKLARLRAEKAEKEKEMERQQELARIASSKELTEARRKQKEQEEYLAQEKRKREKEWEAKERARVKAELAKDKAERLARAGVKVEEAAGSKPEDPYKDRKIALGSKLRDLIGNLRNDPTIPNPANKAMETAGKYVDNIVKNPTEEKFRSINLENAAFQRLVGSKPGGLPMMHAMGFVEADGKLTIPEVDLKWFEIASGELQAAIKRGPFY